MNEVELIKIGWNNLNGFRLELLSIEIGRFEGCLIGTAFGFGDYWQVYILFFEIEIKSPINFK